MLGRPYGYHNMIFSWIDTERDNYPTPMDAHLVASFITMWERIQPDYVANMWNEALNKRLGTDGLDLPEILVECVRRGMSFGALLALPEDDTWLYSDGPSVTCDVLVLMMYKRAGVFGELADKIMVRGGAYGHRGQQKLVLDNAQRGCRLLRKTHASES